MRMGDDDSNNFAYDGDGLDILKGIDDEVFGDLMDEVADSVDKLLLKSSDLGLHFVDAFSLINIMIEKTLSDQFSFVMLACPWDRQQKLDVFKAVYSCKKGVLAEHIKSFQERLS